MNKKTKYIKRLLKASVFFICVIFLVTLPKLADALVYAQVEEIASQVTVQIYAQDPRKPTELIAVGSGVIIPSAEQNKHYVVTNKHVASSGGKYVVKTFDGIKHITKSEDVIELPNLDLSWLKFTSIKNYNEVELGDFQDLNTGDSIYISGWPFNNDNFQFVRGEMRQKNLSPDQKRYRDGYTMSYKAQTGNGMSGGPILDSNGHLMGIHGKRPTLFQLGIPISTFLENAGLSWVQICNQREPPLEISLALAQYVGNGWETKGWYKIKPQSCKPLLAIGENYKGKVYFYARNSEDGYWGTGPKKFCVNMQSNFTIINKENGGCDDSDFRQVQMNELEVYPEMRAQALVNEKN